jgi:hypothetical protein
MSTKRLISCLILTGLVLTPVFGLQDWLEMLRILNFQVDAQAQIVVKLAKDALLGMACLVFVLDVLKGRGFPRSVALYAMISLLLIAFAYTAIEVSPLLALIGLRSLSPLFIIFIAYSYFDMAFIRNLMRVLFFLFVVECIAAMLQAVVGRPIAGLTYFQLAARPFGTFANPWSLAIFTCFVVCFTIGYDIHLYGRLSRMTHGVVVVASVCVGLTQSGAGLLALSTILVLYFLVLSRQHSYVKASLMPALLLTPIVVFFNLAWLTGRARVGASAQTRMDILGNLMDSLSMKGILIGKGLGLGSNAAVTFSRLSSASFEGADALFISDSLYTGLISQVGLLFLLSFTVFSVVVFLHAVRRKRLGVNSIAVMAIPSALVAGLGNNVLELFPVNWLLCIVYGLVLRSVQTDNVWGLDTVGTSDELCCSVHEREL